MNFGEMVKRVQYTLGMEEAAVNDETALAKAYVNEGVVDVLVRTRPYTRVITLVLSANTPVHDMSNTILSLLDVQGSDGRFLDRYSREDIVGRQGQFGAPGFAYEEPLLWVSPVVSQDTAIKAYGIFRPDSMTADTDDASVPTFGGLAPEFHPAVINYALWKASEYVQHEQSAGGERWRTLYEGQDGTGGDIAWIKRILTKRVTPHAQSRRDNSNLGVLSPSSSYLGGGGL